MSFSCGCCRTLGQVLFEYDTPRIVSIKSRKVGLINRLVQLGILAYVIGWVFVWQKGYQQFDSVISSVTTKVKGVAVTNTTDQGVKIWDVADYIIPPQGRDFLFVMTNLIMTLNQQQGAVLRDARGQPHCISDSNCTAGEQSSRSNGMIRVYSDRLVASKMHLISTCSLLKLKSVSVFTISWNNSLSL
ncbi:P2X purinoceptor 4-like isoform X1 [Acipenser oxyrinchus oxyrinchus]|uniref:P2X purinoceptor 4-like isoform X1 n=1 Tax=Acipenser oxyrinchus oxyrinchus TaxID=40147 RepID=A0AAD8CDB7_ACIOX|nr:P2X purinoceptor 4-like isoform X1 [Acipenser oxyrinchus oxyrinchus]